MMISGMSSSTSTLFSNYNVSGTSSSQSSQSEDVNKAGGPPPPPPGGGKGKGPEVDTNSDDVWDTDELTSFSEELAESGASSFSVDELMETYDTDGDGVISASERESIEQNNGLNLPDMKNMQEVMMSGSRGLQIQEASSDVLETVTTEDQAVQNMISAYLKQSENMASYLDLDYASATEV